jgi:hypothetical protein
MAGDPVAGSPNGPPGRRGQRQLLDQVQDFAGQPGRQAGHPGDQLAGRSQDYFRPAGADRLDDLPGGPLGVHRQQRQAGAEREPGELLPGLPGETGLQTRGAQLVRRRSGPLVGPLQSRLGRATPAGTARLVPGLRGRLPGRQAESFGMARR